MPDDAPASEPEPEIESEAPRPLPVADLRWRCDPASLSFSSTAEVEPIPGIVGQDQAIDALRFGVEIHAKGQNVYVRGLQGTGRLTMVRRLLEEIRPQSPDAPDHLYVHDFERPDRPMLITVERGRGELLCEKLGELRRFVVGELGEAMGGEPLLSRKRELERESMRDIEALTDPLEAELRDKGLALLIGQAGGVARPVIMPLVEGQPVPPERFGALIREGKLTTEALEELGEASDAAREQVDATFRKVGERQRRLREQLRDLAREEARRLLTDACVELRELFPGTRVGAYLDALVHDVVQRRLPELDSIEEVAHLYEANLVSGHAEGEPSPVIVEHAPTMRSLLGTLDTTIKPDGSARADHTSVRGGALVRADGGVLVLEAGELLAHPGAWSALVRTLRSGRVELVMPELPLLVPIPSLKPEPIPVDLKVVLVGDSRLYYLLDQLDADFPHLFKVLADFDEVIPRDAEHVALYAGVFARIAREERLPPFSASAIAELAEHGARVAASRGKLTARLGRLADIGREAAFLASARARTSKGEALVEGEDVREAVRRTKRRGDGPARQFREMVADGRIRVATEGRAVGQINGLAVIQAGPLTYGFPTRITASVGTGMGGAVNIERESELSGAIHTKGFFILGGLLRKLLPTEHPLAFDASLAFEQSYGTIDGDSASAAEIVCLLSALTDEPIAQNIAMTGAVDQLGHVLPIGAVNEKIEGFFDTCRARGLDGEQGVVIPRSNVGDLMLRHDVVEACERGEFRVWPVGTIHEALALFFGRAAGTFDPETELYPRGTVLHRAIVAAFVLWRRAQAKPEDFEVIEGDEAPVGHEGIEPS
ncbi:MAG: AAA family ATPase [Myxococcales bacterium]|nr:AAA family ATPase [Myxococcales bacterium]MCB9717214.1 AAA family ATPase [Myxococcales bacterium]